MLFRDLRKRRRLMRILKISIWSFETQNPKPKGGVALKEELVGEQIKGVTEQERAIIKVSYFKGEDSSKWKGKIPTYDLVSLGETYVGIELKLKAYGNNIEKLFYVKPGADPSDLKVELSGGKLNVNKNGELEIGIALADEDF
jgi:hypothetical protein